MSFTGEQQAVPLVMPLAHPLDDLYAQDGLKLPVIEPVPGPEVPEPYKSLLVHEGDMTPTLQRFHKATIHLRVARREQRGIYYFRQVLLITDGAEKPVEFGAIKISLDAFPGPARNDILSERLPLGTILAKYKIGHLSRPKAYLRVQSDARINQAFQLEGTHTLYGRRNTLSTLDQRPFAEIVEILPPEN